MAEGSNEASVILQRAYTENIGDVVAYNVFYSSNGKFKYREVLNSSIQSKQSKVGNTVVDKFVLPYGVYIFYVKGKEDYVYVVNIKKPF